MLNEIPNIDLRIVHIVRDNRAVAYSWQRKKVKPEIHWQTAYMTRYTVTTSAVKWNLMNAFLPPLKYTHAKYTVVRYEDIVTNPHAALLRIARHLGEDWSGLNTLGDEHSMQLGIDHSVAGNPNRFQHGVINIRPDTEWQQHMVQRDKYLVTVLTWPLLLRYGYLKHVPMRVDAAPPAHKN